MAQAGTVVRHDSCEQSSFQYSNCYPNYKSSSFYRNEAITPQPLSPTSDAQQQVRVPLRDVVAKTATQAAQLSQAMVKQALELGQMFWQMQRDLKSKEYKAFLGILGWASTKARKYVNLAKTFDGFERSQLLQVELTTLLSLCSSRRAPVVSQLREVQEITQQLVEQLLKENRSPRKQKQDPVSGWKQNRSGGGRRYEMILHDEKTGLSIEQQALAERILPQRVIAEAVALRAEQKSSPVQPSEGKSEEFQLLDTSDVDNQKLAPELPQNHVIEAACSHPEEKESVLVLEGTTESEDTQELEAHTQEFQVGNSVKIVSARKGTEFGGQIGLVKTVSPVGCVIEARGKTVWFGIDELVLAAEETSIDAESTPHLIESNADFIDDINQEADSLQLNCLEV